ncbi:MAG: hypothetical protein ACYDAD_12765 [Acidimicrobiales bacterium]
MRKLMTLAAIGATGAAGLLGTAFTTAAHATDGCNTAANNAGVPVVYTLPDGGTIYASSPGTSGTVGIQGPHGYLDASGSAGAPPSGAIQGHSADTGVNGKIGGDANTQGAPICVATS